MKLAAIVLLPVFLAGCVSYQNVTQQELPEAWLSALHRPVTDARLFSGTYVNQGEEIADRTSWKGNQMSVTPGVDKGFLVNVISADAQHGVSYDPASATVVQLDVRGSNEVEIVAWQDATVVANRTFKASWDAGLNALVLLDDLKTGGNDSMGAVGVGRQTVRLFKGADGCLYVQKKRAMTGAVLAVVPVSTGDETWGRYPVATR